MNKRGQFFLLAAIVIIGVVFGLSRIYTTIEAPTEDSTIYDLTNEIRYEANTIIDSGIFNAVDKQQRDDNIESLTDHYASRNLGSDFVIIHGNQTDMIARFYKTMDSGGIGFEIAGPGSYTYSQETREFSTTFQLNGDDEVTIVLEEDEEDEDQDIRYTFNIKPGEMFFLVVKEEKRGDQFVSASRDG